MVDKIWYNMEELIGGSEERVLIETYWNVKNIWSARFDVTASINRNILECKGIQAEDNVGFVACINRNILECKVRCSAFYEKAP